MRRSESTSPRLLKLFERYKLRTSWFIPGHSIERFPRQMRQVADAGHEIGAHGYAHENPVSMTSRQEEDVLERAVALIEKHCKGITMCPRRWGQRRQ